MHRKEEREANVQQTGKGFPSLVDDVIVLTGPTASGKSSVAIALAEKLGGEILSLDSIAVYRGMDIGTAKPSVADQSRIKHHLIDVVEPTEDYSVACYLESAHQIVANLKSARRVPIFVGGTPMFLKGILRGFDPGPPADWEFRRAVEADVEKHGIEALRQRLRQVDPLAEHNIGPNDVRRMIRALEVAKLTGQQMSHRQTQFDQYRSADQCNVFAMQVPREQLHQRINQRVQTMFQQGLVDEVRTLLDTHKSLSRTASQAVGYRELIDHFESKSDLAEAQEHIAAHTRQLARRQETWFRSFQEIQPIEAGDPFDAKTVADEIAQRVAARI